MYMQYFHFLFLIHLQELFALSLWGIVFRLTREKNEFNPFWNKAVTLQNEGEVKGCEYFPDTLYMDKCVISRLIFNFNKTHNCIQ